jgi:hypothetical protein
VLDEKMKQVEAGNGAVPNSAGGRARTMDFRARVLGYAGKSAPLFVEIYWKEISL